MMLIELFEARRYPEQNPKTSINDIIQRALDNTTDTVAGTKNLFVSFTTVDKLGINPGSSDRTTPLAIYAYPAEYIVSMIGSEKSMSKLPYAGSARFANLFKARGNIVHLNTITDTDVYFQKLGQLLNDSAKFEDIVTRTESVYSDRHGGALWQVISSVALALSNAKGTPYPVIWNKVIRHIGIDGVVDMDNSASGGGNIIHTNEPCQAAFFSTSAVYDLDRVLNRHSPGDVSVRTQNGTQRHNTILALRSAKTVDEVLSRLTVDGMFRYVKDPALRIEVIKTQPGIIINAPNASVEEQIAAITANPRLVARVKNLEQSTLARIFKEHPRLVFDDAAILRKYENNLTPELQQAMIRQHPELIYKVANPDPDVIKFVIDRTEKFSKNNIPTGLADLAIEHGISYHWKPSGPSLWQKIEQTKAAIDRTKQEMSTSNSHPQTQHTLNFHAKNLERLINMAERDQYYLEHSINGVV